MYSVQGKIQGWFECENTLIDGVSHREIIRCSQVFSWAIHLDPAILVNWLSKKNSYIIQSNYI